MTMETAQKIPAGYKQTDLGIIPADWSAFSLGDVCTIKTGKKDVNEGNPLGQYPFFTCSRESTFSDHYSFDGEAILIAGNGEVGNLHYYKGKFEAYQRTYVLQNFTLLTEYLWHELDSGFKKSLGIGKIGSSIPYIKRENIAEYTFVIPNADEEQRTIASTLSDTDTLINKLEKLIKKKKCIKQGAMQELLTGKRRLPGFNDKWKAFVLPDLLREADGIKIGPFGSQLKKEYLVSSGYKVYGQENVFDRNVYIGDRFLNKTRFMQLRSCELKAGDFVISMMGTVGKCMIMPNEMQQGIMDSHLLRLRFNKKLACPNFFLHLFASHIITSQIRQLSVGGIMEGLSSKIIRALSITLPDVEEQEKISEALNVMDGEISTLTCQIEKYRHIKQGMMQMLLTGKVRLITK